MSQRPGSKLPRTLGELPVYAAGQWPDNEGLYFEGRSWSYAELSGEVDRTALALIGAGVRAQDRVALWITNRPQFLFSFFAILRIGAVAVPLNTRWRTRDLLFALRHSEACALLSETESGPVDFEAMVRETLGEVRLTDHGALSSQNCPCLRTVVFLSSHHADGGMEWGRFMQRADKVATGELLKRASAVDPDRMALLMYTSGTTGTPKGVMLSHVGIRFSFERARALGVTAKDVQLNYLPVFHIYSQIFVVLPCFLTGAKQVVMNRFDAQEALRLVEKERVTILHGFDTHYNELLAAYRTSDSSYDISSLRSGTFSAGAETARSVALQVQQTLCRTISCYGQSETWGAITAGPIGCTIDQSCSASGYPLPGVELRIVDPLTRQDVEAGQVGEIMVRSDSVMLGYYNAEQETKATIDEAGWVRTGDAGCIRADGHLRFMGRYKDMLKVGGENVDPAEVEALLLESPLVDKVAIVGCPDDRLSEVVAAFIVPVPGADTTEIRRHVDALCKGAIASFKIPRRLEFIAEMPINATGKIDKKVLRQQLPRWSGESE